MVSLKQNTMPIPILIPILILIPIPILILIPIPISIGIGIVSIQGTPHTHHTHRHSQILSSGSPTKNDRKSVHEHQTNLAFIFSDLKLFEEKRNGN